MCILDCPQKDTITQSRDIVKLIELLIILFCWAKIILWIDWQFFQHGLETD